jgi:hypothetical protein
MSSGRSTMEDDGDDTAAQPPRSTQTGKPISERT